MTKTVGRVFGAIAMTSALMCAAAAQAEAFKVAQTTLVDHKAVFATVESANTVPARARIGGTVAELLVNEGDAVISGQPVARIGDEKLVLQLQSLSADIAAAQARQRQASTDLDRAQDLFAKGTIPKARLDDARTAFSVADNDLKAATGRRSVVEEQLSEGEVLSPTAGRVLHVPVTPGTVVLPGEALAVIADEATVLRLRLPERHGRALKIGDTVRLADPEPGAATVAVGKITLVYPAIEDGRVVADAAIEDLGKHFFGERVRVVLPVGIRQGIAIPARFVTQRYGIDYVDLQTGEGEHLPVPVQLGQDLEGADAAGQVEVLSGLVAGDVIVAP